MPWFKVDDGLAFHRKTVAAGNPAMGLWVRAGSWCAQQLTDGFVPEHMIAILGTPAQAARLVKVGMWVEVPGGFEFHQWNENGRQPTGEAVRAEREKSARRQAEWRARKSDDPQVTDTGNGVTPPLVTPSVTPPVTGAPTRPDPTRPLEGGYLGGEGARGERGGAPRPRCPRHAQLPPDADVPPCGQCAERRRAAEQNNADGVLGELAARTSRRAAIDGCGRCDDNGMRETDTGVTRCAHAAKLEAVS